MKASLMVSIAVFIISLASFGSGAIQIICGIASAAWILFVLWWYDRAEVIDEARYEEELARMRENRKKAPCWETRHLKGSAK